MRCIHWLVCTALALAGCQGGVDVVTVNAASAAPPSARIEPEMLERIARQYESWGRVDDTARWAPTMCNPDLQRPYGGDARLSESGDTASHGGKLYFVYAKNPDAYAFERDKPQPEGQVIVKQAFAAQEVSADEAALGNGHVTSRQAPHPCKGSGTAVETVDWNALTRLPPRLAVKDGKSYAPGQPYALFVMVKGNAVDPGTDGGWLYAATSMDGKTILSNGRMSSCMECHADAPHDRLFGLPAVKR